MSISNNLSAIYDSGSASMGSTTVLLDSSKGWATNQWRGFWIEMHSGSNSGQTGEVLSSDASSLTLRWPFMFPVAAGDKYVITASGTPAMTYTVYGVSAEITSTEPGMLFLDGEGHATVDTKIKYSIKPPDDAEADKLRVILAATAEPNERKRLQSRIDAITAEYNAIITDIDIFERVAGSLDPNDDLWKDWLPGNATSGEGTATIFRGKQFDTSKDYYVQVVLNKGSEVEVRGEKVKLLFNASALIPDYNRDGIIDDTDRKRALAGDTFYFWINDDDDEGETEGSDIPGATKSYFGVDYVNYQLDNVDGIRDLIDFFPVYLDIKSLLNLYSPNEYSYRLVSEDESLNFAYTYIKATNSRDYLTGGLDNLEPAPTLGNTVTYKIGPSGTLLDPTYLEYVKNGEGLGLLLFEGRKVSTKALEFRVYDSSGHQVTSLKLNLSLSGVEQMFGHKNLTLYVKPGAQIAPESKDGVVDRWDVPNCPDVECLGADPQNIKNFVFLHGYNVNGQQARGWHSEMFKRMFWSGSQARFWGVTWYGWDSQAWLSVLGNTTVNYYDNVLHAFQTSPYFTLFLASLPGEKIVAAHSLGNMVVSSAIADYNAPINKYFLFNAAVALEAFNETEDENTNMLPSMWDGYDPKLRAAEWYKLFKGQNPPDFREQLTWRNRFNGVKDILAYNYHSKGDEVVSWVWEKEERLKGAVPIISPYGGWEFNHEWDVYDPYQWKYVTLPASQANLIDSAELMSKPFFNRDGLIDSLLKSGPPATEGGKMSMRNELLSRAFPATTAATGRSYSKAVKDNNNINMQEKSKTDKNGIKYWPSSRKDTSWLHSDIKDVAYPYVYSVFDSIVNIEKGVIQ